MRYYLGYYVHVASFFAWCLVLGAEIGALLALREKIIDKLGR